MRQQNSITEEDHRQVANLIGSSIEGILKATGTRNTYDQFGMRAVIHNSEAQVFCGVFLQRDHLAIRRAGYYIRRADLSGSMIIDFYSLSDKEEPFTNRVGDIDNAVITLDFSFGRTYMNAFPYV